MLSFFTSFGHQQFLSLWASYQWYQPQKFFWMISRYKKKVRLVLLHLLFVLNVFDYKRQLPYYLLYVIRNRVVAQNEGTRRIWVSLAALATGMRSNLAEGTSALCLLFVLCSSPKWKLTGFLWCFQSHGSKIVAKEYVSVCSIARFSLFLIL